MSESVRRRRRVRSGDPQPAPEPPAGDPAPAAVAEEVMADTAVIADEPVPWALEPIDPETLPAERGLRGLVGGGSSQVSPASAMRARDAARPRPEDLARAAADLAIVRRHWAPRD